MSVISGFVVGILITGADFDRKYSEHWVSEGK
jgi:hypothetical protein